MDFSLRLEMHQKLMMTQELRQAIAILQLSTQELATALENEFLENPILEYDITSSSEKQSEQARYTFDEISALERYLYSGGKDKKEQIYNADNPSFEFFAARETSLHDHLEFQLDITVTSNLHHEVGRYLIGCIDNNGYLRCQAEEVSLSLNVPVKFVLETLNIIQTFEPDGVGARDLRECLEIQAKSQGIYNNVVKKVIQNHLQDLASARYRYISEKLNCTLPEVQEAVDVIRKLNPKPGLSYSAENAGYIVPDVTIERVNEEYVILINDSSVPKLVINPAYRQASSSQDHELKKYIENRLNSAIWLIRSVEQRRNTLYNVTKAIVELQRGFFDYGPQHLRPLIMKTVADRLGIHESTVSRVVANKYIDTPHGVLSMRTFFANRVNVSSGEEFIASNIKKEIQSLIRQENCLNPLSDQAVSELLTKQGITISRRTVTKYREEMGIASSTKRKRYDGP
ncbi:RNA polymerase factor sigma-54 [Dendrosporobacter sp. 1207_IL3150]|uniref:RNA polymerase factor sigma-54 n=1 Tax=Dendrosporobacter sp. 1207_IL3150 TaxID=3084054 RepID=UPI002FD99847